ncbi:DUF2189 domain-containing protein [Flavobacterium aurantiibacter]|uniref:Beta-carotene 15,15'-monooxygenase n=1 Tax=Flavobacterium aurantiibacter TaxID=2023067 RepID=A0A255ZRI5_9FLAO|nr:hypothetical protein [Flavobacterium aurantiibacter]OYQ43544.1 hypothetical protein CHX27_09895 [Flavobacterium aurantiibacter]
MSTFNANEPVHLSFGEAIEQTFNTWKKIALLMGGILILLGIVAAIIYGGIFAVIFGTTDLTNEILNMQSLDNQTPRMVLTLIFTIIAAAVFSPITAGLLQIAHNAESGEDYSFNTAFEHYKSVHVKDIILSAVIINLVSQGFSIVGELFALQTDAISTFIAGLLSLVLTILTFMSIPFIIFGKLDAVESIKASISVCGRKFFIILLLMIVVGLCIGLGILGLCIGIFFTMPLYYTLQYNVYRLAIGIDNVDELSQIGEDSN